MSIVMILLMLILFWSGGPVQAPEPVQVDSSAWTDVAVPAPLTIDGVAVSAIASEPATGAARFVVAGDRLYRADGNEGWVATGVAPQRDAVIADSRNADVLWAGTGLDCYRGGAAAVALRHSSDAGTTWTERGPEGYVPLAAWDPGDIVIAHDCAGLQVSRDAGVSWTMPDGLPLGSQVTGFAVASPPEAAAGLVVLVGVTGEGGTSQLYRVDLSDPERANVDGPLATWWGHAPLAVDGTGAILIGAPQGVLRSEDDGTTWQTLRAGLESTTLAQDPIEHFPADVEPGSFGLTAFAELGNDVIVAGVDGLYCWNGDLWENVAALDEPVKSLAIMPGTSALLAVTDAPSVVHIDIAKEP